MEAHGGGHLVEAVRTEHKARLSSTGCDRLPALGRYLAHGAHVSKTSF